MQRSSSVDFLVYVFLSLLFSGCFQNADESKNNILKERSVDSVITKAEKADTLNRFQFIARKGDTTKVVYSQNSVQIKFGNMRSSVNIPYSSPVNDIVPCNCLAIKKEDGQFSYETHYLYQDSFLLLPVMDLNNRINLFVVNINDGKLLQAHKPMESMMLTTSLTWFIVNEKSGIITTANSFDLEGNTTTHLFQIAPSEIKYIKSMNKKASLEVYSDEAKMKDFIKLISF